MCIRDRVKGKNHLIADALSRAPYFEASEENELYCHAIFCLQVSGDPALAWLQECKDEEYNRIKEAILNDYGYKNLQGAKMLKEIWHDLSVDGETDLILFGNRRILVPNNAIKHLLKLLHQSHCGFTKTYNLAHELYYWGGMRNDNYSNERDLRSLPEHITIATANANNSSQTLRQCGCANGARRH